MFVYLTAIYLGTDHCKEILEFGERNRDRTEDSIRGIIKGRIRDEIRKANREIGMNDN